MSELYGYNLENEMMHDKNFLNLYEVLIATDKNNDNRIISHAKLPFFKMGKINGHYLEVKLPYTKIIIDLEAMLDDSISAKREEVVKTLLDADIDIQSIKPNIMTLIVNAEMDDLTKFLISKKIPINFNNYESVYQLAYFGKLDILKLIMETYHFPNIVEIAAKITANAIRGGQINVLQYFCPPESFKSAPDVISVFFTNSIIHGGHLPIVKYFVNNGVSIKHDQYAIVETAKKYKRADILEYFCQLDENVKKLL